jgi:hypothetical protein
MPEDTTAQLDTTESQTEETTEEETEQTSTEGTQEEKEEKKPSPSETVPIGRFNEVWGQMRRFERLASQLLEEKKADLDKVSQPTPKEEVIDFDNMTPKQLVELVEKRAEKRAQEIVEKTLGPMQQKTQAKEINASIGAAQAKYPDFWDYKDDMIELANAHPTLNAEEVYLLASGQKGLAGDKLLGRLKSKIDQTKRGLTERRSSPASRQGKVEKYGTVREGVLAAAKELGYNVE